MAYSFDGAFANVNSALANLGKQNDARWLREAQADVGQSLQNGDYTSAAQKAFKYGDSATGLGLLKLGEQAKERAADADLLKGIGGLYGGGQALGQIGKVSVMQPNEVQSQFINGVKQAGLTNPVGLAAVAATGQAESSFLPQNVNRSWSDPSQSGQPGQAGGVMSWRADRLQNLQRFAASKGEQGNGSPATQAAFLAQEDPTLIPRLNAAKSPEEAAGIMARAWRFAGYDRPGGEAANRVALTRQYADKFGGGQPVQMAQAAPQSGAPTPDVPAQGSAEAQFYVPGTDVTVPQSLASNPRIQYLTQALAAARTEGGKASIKQRLELEIKDAERAYNEGKTPDAVKEWAYARRNGLTDAKSPVEYAAEKEKAKKNSVDDTVQERQDAAARAGLKPGDPAYQGYILTGKMPREDMGPLTATDKKAILEADEAVQSSQTAIKALQDAKKLSPQALGGWGAGSKAALANNLPDWMVPDLIASPQKGEATANLDNLVTSQALAQLKSIFGAAPTEGERKILLDIQGSVSQPDNIRQQIYDRAIQMAERRLVFNQQRAAELRGGDFYKSPEKRAQSGPAPMPPQAPQPPQGQALGGASPQPPRPPQPAQAPVRVQSPQEALRLPSGTPIILPDGRIGEVP